MFLSFGHFIRYNLSFKEIVDDGTDDLDVDTAESDRPQFSDIKKDAGFLDRQLAASGFTREDQKNIQQVQSSLI